MNKNRKTKLRGVAWLLTLCMVVTISPFMVFADDVIVEPEVVQPEGSMFDNWILIETRARDDLSISDRYLTMPDGENNTKMKLDSNPLNKQNHWNLVWVDDGEDRGYQILNREDASHIVRMRGSNAEHQVAKTIARGDRTFFNLTKTFQDENREYSILDNNSTYFINSYAYPDRVIGFPTPLADDEDSVFGVKCTKLRNRWRLSYAPPESSLVVDSKSDTSITFEDMGDSVEYKKSDGVWQNSREFNNLEPDTDYVFYMRNKRTSIDGINVAASKSSEGVTVRTDVKVSDNAKLKSLSIKDLDSNEVTLEPEFNPKHTSYTTTVDYNVDSVDITAKTKDSGAYITVDGNTDLEVNENEFIITVTAEDEITKRVYIIKVKRESDDPLIKAISAGHGFTMVMKDDNSIKAFGSDFNSRVSSINESGIMDTVMLSAGHNFSLILRSNGAVQALGDNDFTNQVDDINNANITDAKSISAGHFYSIIVNNDGTVNAFGSNNNVTHVNESGISNAITATTSSNPVILKNNGTIKVLGSDVHGVISAVNDSNVDNVIAVSGRGGFFTVLKEDGTIKTFGNNWNDRDMVPEINDSNISNVVGISAGLNHLLILKSDGTVQAFGCDTSGSVDGVNESEINNAVSVVAGVTHSIIIKEDGTAQAFGNPHSESVTAINDSDFRVKIN